VRFRGFHADAQEGGYIFGGFSFRRLVGELGARARLWIGGMRFGIVGSEDGARDAGTKINLAAQDLLNGMNQFSGNLALQNVALYARA